MKEYPAREVRREPTHPGALLSEILPALDLGVSDAAAKLGVTRQTLHRIIRGQTAVTPEMAVRLGKFCGNGANLWLAMQHGYDLWHARRKLGAAIDAIPTMKQA